jgi:hypothetical protein
MPDLGYLFRNHNHFEQLVVNLVLEGKQHLAGSGSLILGGCIHTESDPSWRAASYVRIFVRAERASDVGTASENFSL